MDKIIYTRDILKILEEFAPLALQENYDNSGLQIGDVDTPIKGILIALDCTEEIIQEAIAKQCDLIITHHPLIFKGVKKISSSNYIERNIKTLLVNNIQLISWHTNLDHVFQGVNYTFAQKIGLENCQILAPQTSRLLKLITYCPIEHTENVQQALFLAGAGNIGNYQECSFISEGTGSFTALDSANPWTGNKNERHLEAENKIEVLIEKPKLPTILKALFSSHPYEEVAYDLVPIENVNPQIGAGMLGWLSEPMKLEQFLNHLKTVLNTNVIKYSAPINKPIQKVAICGGSGFFLLNKALQEQVDAFITSDLKYHDFFEANGRLLIADVGHFESEQATNILFWEVLTKKIPNFAIQITEKSTNSVNYHI